MFCHKYTRGLRDTGMVGSQVGNRMRLATCRSRAGREVAAV